MKKAITILFIILFFFTCCGKKREKILENNNKLSHSETIKGNCIPLDSFSEEIRLDVAKYLKIQLNMEKDDNRDSYKMATKDIEIACKIMFKVLCKSAFIPIEKNEFDKVIFQKFGITYNKKYFNIIFHDTFFTYLVSQGGDLDYLRDTEYDYTYKHIYFISEYGFITEVPFLRDLINDDEINKESKVCIPDKFVHRNKYLFNNSQSSLTWLVHNDIEFLEILLREFGYDKDDKINSAILNKINKEFYDENQKNRDNNGLLINLFAKKDCDGNLTIREGLMKFISTNYDKQFGTPINILDHYATIMSIVDSEDYPDITSPFNRQERLKIVAYAGYYEDLAREKYYSEGEWTPASFFSNTLDDGLLEEIERNNYYGLPGFKEILDSAQAQIEAISEEYARTHPMGYD